MDGIPQDAIAEQRFDCSAIHDVGSTVEDLVDEIFSLAYSKIPKGRS